MAVFVHQNTSSGLVGKTDKIDENNSNKHWGTTTVLAVRSASQANSTTLLTVVLLLHAVNLDGQPSPTTS